MICGFLLMSLIAIPALVIPISANVSLQNLSGIHFNFCCTNPFPTVAESINEKRKEGRQKIVCNVKLGFLGIIQEVSACCNF